ncbi:MAG: phosphoribosyl-ATP diphosphatase [Pseudomonadota bacterium]
MNVLADLAATIAARKTAAADTSYTASLLAGGIEKCAKKFGEEAVELLLAAPAGDTAHSAAEAADVLYHLLVLLEASEVSFDEVLDTLAARQGMSGHAEKAARSS